jgi:isoleucyl-tRNA synthetase
MNMKFKSGTRRRAIEYEKDLVQQWKINKTFQKSIDNRPKDNSFVFYDGPPFITGVPHHGTLLISTIKDTIARYQTMKGKRVERRWGWDCHGLPAEVYVEKKLGIENRSEIGTKISVDEYVNACRTAMEQGGNEWEGIIDRLGRWVEFEGAYKTMDKDYMESIWWAFKELYENGKIYEGEKVLLYCTRDATPISKSEVAMENSYKETTDASLFVYLDLVDEPASLLAWTTTPWTLPANVVVAVNPKLTYVEVEYNNKKIILAKDLVEKVFTDEKHQSLEYKVTREFSGKTLVGKSYKPLFENHGPNAHKVVSADFVTSDDGTGIVHIAPAYGEDDFNLSREENLPVVHVVDENGLYSSGPWLGKNIWETNKEIAKTLLTENKALKIEYVTHEYPHCHRCGTKLMYRAHSSWFMDIQNQKESMLDANESSSWVPKALQDKRFKNVILSAPDWNLSRDRFWATPIPVWKGRTPAGDEVIKAFGSYAEFEEFTGQKLDDYHLPKVMNVEFELDGATMHHIGKVIDCWFESGSMPFAQFHYPFENKEKFENSFPADFIVEGVDQTRGWFYSLTAVNVALFNKSPFKNLICTGFINAADGQKISKKLKNYTDPADLMDKTSVDSFRLFLLSSPLTSGEDANLADKDVVDTSRKLAMIWNMYDFFTMYAEVDGWVWDGTTTDPSKELSNPLDIWIVSRLHQLIKDVEEGLSTYQLQAATKSILPFIDDASNWYVRRSRRRFWKSGDDADKNEAYKTLHYVLTQLSLVMAPFTPFLAEELYKQLTGGESVHLLDWPETGHINELLVKDMSTVRELITKGLSERAEAKIKVRQPLRMVEIRHKNAEKLRQFEDILNEELNVKFTLFNSETSDQNDNPDEYIIEVNTEIDEELKSEGLMREVVRLVQNARKQAGLQVDDRIKLNISTENMEIAGAIEQFKKEIADETLAVSLAVSGSHTYSHITTAQIEKSEIAIAIAIDEAQ